MLFDAIPHSFFFYLGLTWTSWHKWMSGRWQRGPLRPAKRKLFASLPPFLIHFRARVYNWNFCLSRIWLQTPFNPCLNWFQLYGHGRPGRPLYIFKSVELIESATYIYHALWFLSRRRRRGGGRYFLLSLFVCCEMSVWTRGDRVEPRFPQRARRFPPLFFFRRRELPLDLYRYIFIC